MSASIQHVYFLRYKLSVPVQYFMCSFLLSFTHNLSPTITYQFVALHPTPKSHSRSVTMFFYTLTLVRLASRLVFGLTLIQFTHVLSHVTQTAFCLFVAPSTIASFNNTWRAYRSVSGQHLYPAPFLCGSFCSGIHCSRDGGCFSV